MRVVGEGRRVLYALVLALLLFCSYTQCDAASSDKETESDALRQLLASGDAAMSRGRRHYQEALAKYTEALQQNPLSKRGLYSRAELYSLLRERTLALHDLDALLHLAPDHIRGVALRLSLHAQSGDLGSAARDAAHLLTLYTRAGQTVKANEVKQTLRKLERYANEWSELHDLLEADLIQPIHTPRSGNAATTSRPRYESCVRLLTNVLNDFAKDNVRLHLTRAACALALHDNQLASADLHLALQREPQNLLAIALNARALRELGALEQARGELRRCLSIDPEYAPCAHLHRLLRNQQKNIKRVEELMQAENYKAAIEAMTDALEAEPHAPYEEQVMQWQCKAYVHVRDVEHGISVCQAVLQLLGTDNPASEETHLNLAELYLLDDDTDAAMRALQAARHVNPRSEKAAELERKVERVKQNAGRKDYYKILGVKKTASAAEIRRAYRKLAKMHHPDQLRSKNLDDKERERQDRLFRDINEAKEVLLDDDKRARYDSGEDVTKPMGQNGGQPFYGQPFQFHFNGFPGGFPGGFAGGFPGGGQQRFFYFQQG